MECQIRREVCVNKIQILIWWSSVEEFEVPDDKGVFGLEVLEM